MSVDGLKRYRALLAVAVLSLLAFWHLRSRDGESRELAGPSPVRSPAPPAQRESDPPATARARSALRGTVVGADGAGVRASILAVKAGVLAADAPRLLADSGADGRFVLTGVEPGHYEVWAWSADGHGASTNCDVADDTTSVELRLEQSGAPAHGIVRDVAGGTVAAAELRFMHANAGLDRTVALARSDADGRYRLRLPAGNYLARVSASGYALTQGVLQVGRAGAEQHFTLTPAAGIVGRVVHEDGTPAPDAALTLRPAGLDTIQAQWPRPFGAGRDGTFSARDVPPGSYMLVAETTDESATFGPFQLDAGDERGGLELVLGAGQRLRVEVADERGLPVEAATIEVRQDRAGVPSRSVSLHSDARGLAEPRGLLPEHATVVVANHPEYEQRIEALGALEPRSEPRVLRLTLRRATRVTGRVLSGGGEPVAGVRVSVDAPGNTNGTYASTLSDEKGEFALRVTTAAAAEARYVVEARHTEDGLTRLEVSDLARPLTLSLSPGLYVDGAVRDERGAAVPFARVSAMQIEPRVRGSEALVVADAEGVFHIGPFASGVVRVELQGAVIAAPTSRARAQVDLGSRGASGVTLLAPTRQSRVTGRVLDANGEPIGGVTVLLAPERSGIAARTEGSPAITDTRGEFVCEGLYAGPHRAFVEALGYASIEHPISAPGSLEVRLGRGAAALAAPSALPVSPGSHEE